MPLSKGLSNVFRVVMRLRPRGRSRASPGGRRRESGKNAAKKKGANGGNMGSPVEESPFRGMAKSGPKSMLKAPAPPHNPPASRRPSAVYPGGLRTIWGQYSPHEGRPARGQHLQPRQALLPRARADQGRPRPVL